MRSCRTVRKAPSSENGGCGAADLWLFWELHLGGSCCSKLIIYQDHTLNIKYIVVDNTYKLFVMLRCSLSWPCYYPAKKLNTHRQIAPSGLASDFSKRASRASQWLPSSSEHPQNCSKSATMSGARHWYVADLLDMSTGLILWTGSKIKKLPST